MRIASVPAAAAAVALPRRDAQPRDARTVPALDPRLPTAVTDRLAGLMAQDPGLAAAVSAHLPAARAALASDLAAYAPPAPPTIDIRS